MRARTKNNGQEQKRSAGIGVFQARLGARGAAPANFEAGPVGLDGFASSTTGDAVRRLQPADGGTIVKTAQEAIKGAVALR